MVDALRLGCDREGAGPERRDEERFSVGKIKGTGSDVTLPLELSR
jgi:hypothetical protein